MSALLNFVFSPPPSLFLMAMSAISIIHVSHNGLSEVMGKHMNYSKFWNVNVPTNKKGWMETTVPSKAGMLFAYVPAAVAAIASFFIPGIVVGTRAQLLSCALTLHFFKRVFERLWNCANGWFRSDFFVLKTSLPLRACLATGGGRVK